MHLLNLEIEKICIHQIFKRNSDGSKKTPEKSSDFVRFDAAALETFRQRVVDALGSHSKAVDMKIVEQDTSKAPSLFTSLKSASDEEFISTSYILADQLAEAQKRKALSGGIVVVFRGTYGSLNTEKRKSILGVIKADIYSAYKKIENEITKEISLEYVKEALLTPSTKLFKTAAFAEKNTDSTSQDLNEKWQVAISDYQINQADGKVAAQYFYETFLGCGYPESSARHTKQFFDSTKSFINGLDISNEAKYELTNALVCYLKLDQSGVVSPNQFAQTYFNADTSDDFIAHLTDAGVPTTSFTKDTQFVASKLKIQKVSFGQSIRLMAPVEAFKNTVIMEAIEQDEEGNRVDWTKLVIKEKMAIPN